MKRYGITFLVLLCTFGVAVASTPVETTDAPATSDAAESCESAALDLSAMTEEELEAWAKEGNFTITRTGGSLPSCPTEPRRCANAQGGCAPTPSCTFNDTGLAGCEAADGFTIECKYGQTVHERTCVCDAPGAPCYGTDLRLICQ